MIPHRTVVTKRLMLELTAAPILEDLNHIVKWLNDPEVVKYSEQRHKVHTLKSELAYIESILWPSQFRLIVFENELIGTMTAHVDADNSVADIGIMIGDKTQWEQGFGAEAWIGLMGHLFNLGIRKIEGGCMDLNKAMIGIFRKSGMKQEGCRPGHFLIDDATAGMELWGRFSNG